MSPVVLLGAGLGAVFASLLLGLTATGVFAPDRRQVGRTLAAVRALGLTGDVGIPETASFRDRVLRGLYEGGVGFARRLTAKGWAAKMARRLDLAGNPRGWDVEQLLAVKTIALVALGGLGMLFGRSQLSHAVLFTAVGALAGFLLPDLLLYNAGTKRQLKIGRDLPEALDLLTVSVEAGLGFDAALAQVARNFEGPLSGECSRVLQEMNIGKTRGEALKALSARTEVPELHTFVTSLVQADSFGIPVANVLREQSREMRVKRFQRAEETAQKVPVKILFPLLACIFPALFIVILGPAGISIAHTFAGG